MNRELAAAIERRLGSNIRQAIMKEPLCPESLMAVMGALANTMVVVADIAYEDRSKTTEVICLAVNRALESFPKPNPQ